MLRVCDQVYHYIRAKQYQTGVVVVGLLVDSAGTKNNTSGIVVSRNNFVFQASLLY